MKTAFEPDCGALLQVCRATTEIFTLEITATETEQAGREKDKQQPPGSVVLLLSVKEEERKSHFLNVGLSANRHLLFLQCNFSYLLNSTPIHLNFNINTPRKDTTLLQNATSALQRKLSLCGFHYQGP